MFALESKIIRNGFLPLVCRTVKRGSSLFIVFDPTKIASTFERNL